MGAEDRLQSLVEKAKEAITAVHSFTDAPLLSTYNALIEVREHAASAVGMVAADIDNAGEAD
jgi:hypothetical protein